MKKVIMILIASLAFSGAIFAQHESHWADFNTHDYQFNMPTAGFVQIGGNFITSSDNWADLEIGVFVGDDCRGHAFMVDETDMGDPYPYFQIGIYYNTTNEEVSFMLYDHSIGLEYGICTPNISILTGEDHVELYFDYDEAVVLNFTSPYTKSILGYGEKEGGYYLIATPVDGINPSNVGNMTTGTYDLYSFDQTKELEWCNYKQGNGFNLVSGKGYLYANQENVTLTFNGTPIEGNTYDVSLVMDENASWKGWNLVGNPFADQTAYINRDFYTMNDDGSEIMAAEVNGIAPMEGVFVIATENAETLTFSTEKSEVKGSLIALNLVKNNNIIDRAIIRFGEGRTLPKFQIRNNSTKVYIPMDDQDYAVVRSLGIGEMPVNFKADENGFYTLNVNGKEVIFDYLHLIDNLTGTDVNLLESPCYRFEAKTTDYDSRFKLVYSTISGNVDCNNENFAFFSNGNLVIKSEGNATLQVVDMMGRIIFCRDALNASLSTAGMTPGVYVLRLIQGDTVKTQKIVVK